jgi:hypothetical protein
MKKRFLKYSFVALSLFFVIGVVSGNNLIEKVSSSLSIKSVEVAVTVMQIDTDQSWRTDRTTYQSTFPYNQFFKYACYTCNCTISNPGTELTKHRVTEKLQV